MPRSDFTIDENMKFASQRAAALEAEKCFFDQNQPHFPLGFSVGYRNPGHWDIYAEQCKGKASAFRAAHPDGQTSEQDGGRERAFTIRGRAPIVTVHDCRWDPHRPHPRNDNLTFKSVTGAMLWVMEELMQEPVVE